MSLLELFDRPDVTTDDLMRAAERITDAAGPEHRATPYITTLTRTVAMLRDLDGPAAYRHDALNAAREIHAAIGDDQPFGALAYTLGALLHRMVGPEDYGYAGWPEREEYRPRPVAGTVSHWQKSMRNWPTPVTDLDVFSVASGLADRAHAAALAGRADEARILLSGLVDLHRLGPEMPATRIPLLFALLTLALHPLADADRAAAARAEANALADRYVGGLPEENPMGATLRTYVELVLALRELRLVAQEQWIATLAAVQCLYGRLAQQTQVPRSTLTYSLAELVPAVSKAGVSVDPRRSMLLFDEHLTMESNHGGPEASVPRHLAERLERAADDLAERFGLPELGLRAMGAAVDLLRWQAGTTDWDRCTEDDISELFATFNTDNDREELARLLNNYAYALGVAGRWAEALPVIEEALDVRPTDLYRLTLAETYEGLGRDDEAAEIRAEVGED
ncbi:hypothetical protein Val02_22310 [Virgisporangium aliadipatigenens]|uniref:Tetratricopeptide repeat protein n=1 Tax=Virgisporangium aliadipatigenens TaxID=741659 RepID=A0A8J3YJZ1_9ACTN|nr:tetratricopeptide repeat protein [Virgisporangium aliadipatigenens]GIJ45345.1 hypothetical protein Val02_22310 [Virgisporangium aliadipatigenens]